MQSHKHQIEVNSHFNLLATAMLRQGGKQLALLTARTHCWLTLYGWSTRTPRSFATELLFSQLISPQPGLLQGLTPSPPQDSAFALVTDISLSSLLLHAPKKNNNSRRRGAVGKTILQAKGNTLELTVIGMSFLLVHSASVSFPYWSPLTTGQIPTSDKMRERASWRC